jgi:flavin reductase (DIM6/NTAB) family NADH-FMN oxidoreductase RutF
MFYEPKDGHGLPHNPFSAIVAPRPIGWISTRGALGDNIAPYSFFNAVAYDPPQVMFAGGLKDTIRNVQQSGVFAVNIVSRAMLNAMNKTSAALQHGTDEFAYAAIPKAECNTIACPRVLDAPATLECCMTQILPLAARADSSTDFMVIGTVLGVHIHASALNNGRFDPALFGQMARLGYHDYAEIRSAITLARPD